MDWWIVAAMGLISLVTVLMTKGVKNDRDR